LSAAWLSALRALRQRRSIILCYHGIGPSDPAADPYFLRVPADRFRRQVELLLEAGFGFRTVADLVDSFDGDRPPPGLAALSFDDGMDDNHSVLMPLLREYGVPATVYVTTGVIGQENPWLPGTRMMTEDELGDLGAAGFELGAHTVTHPDLATLGYDDCLREMRESKEEVERITGTPARTFAYPFCSYGPEALAAARDAGFTAAVTCHGRGGWSRFELRRSMVGGKDGMPSFVLKVAGAYEPLFDSPPGRLFRGSTRAVRERMRRTR
jgi:peptidoglycan/xylan/chitin deacetylase (PgdA/CDA1 family)